MASSSGCVWTHRGMIPLPTNPILEIPRPLRSSRRFQEKSEKQKEVRPVHFGLEPIAEVPVLGVKSIECEVNTAIRETNRAIEKLEAFIHGDLESRHGDVDATTAEAQRPAVP